jgi:hypothetical protein
LANEHDSQRLTFIRRLALIAERLPCRTQGTSPRIGSLLALWQWNQRHLPQQKTLPVDDGWQGDLVRRRLDSGEKWKTKSRTYHPTLF